MILKEDTPAEFTGRSVSTTGATWPLSSAAPPSDLAPSYLPTSEAPSYHPPSFPPAAHLLSVPTDPAPWRSAGPPPRYKSPKRPFRLVPLLLSIALAALVLGSAVNCLVESVLKISRVHIKVQMFRIFQRILQPTLVLIAAPVFTIVILPIHHLLPLPTNRTPFWKASHRHRALVVGRLGIPVVNTVLYLLGGCWYLSVALIRGDDSSSDALTVPANGDGEGKVIVGIPSGGQSPIFRDGAWPREGEFWTPWFFRDPNVKLVVFSSAAALAWAAVYLWFSLPSSAVYQAFAGPKPPKTIGRWEKTTVRWWRQHVVGRRQPPGAVEAREQENEAELERMLPGSRAAGVASIDGTTLVDDDGVADDSAFSEVNADRPSAIDDQTAVRSSRFQLARTRLLEFGRQRTSRSIRASSAAAAGPLAI